jgi:Uri superfamily endonuclease
MECAPGREKNVTYNCGKGYPLNTNLPSSPGSYAIVMFNLYPRKLTIGALDRHSFPQGCYIYVGSAHGPGGLHARVGRHLDHTAMKPSHWHIDALTSVFEITEVWWVASKENVECLWAGWLSETLSRHVPNFGASDCRCPGHLIFAADQRGISDALSYLRQNFEANVHQLEVKSETHKRSVSHGAAD